MNLNSKIKERILDGALRENKSDLAGKYRGYYVSYGIYGGIHTVVVNAFREDDPGNAGLFRQLQSLKDADKKRISSATVKEYSARIQFKTPALGKQIPDMINSTVKTLVDWLILNGYQSGCGECGRSDCGIDQYLINGESNFLCPECANLAENRLIDNQQEIRAQKSRTVPGLVGAFLGGLIGAVLWIAIYRLGYIAGIAGLVTVLCAMKGYELLGGCLDRKGVVLSALVSLLIVYLSNHISWTWSAYDVLKDYDWSFGEIFAHLFYVLRESELTGAFFGEMAMGFFLSLLTSVARIVRSFKESSGSYQMEKI